MRSTTFPAIVRMPPRKSKGQIFNELNQIRPIKSIAYNPSIKSDFLPIVPLKPFKIGALQGTLGALKMGR